MNRKKQPERAPAEPKKQEAAPADSFVDWLNKFKLRLAAILAFVIFVVTQLNTGWDEAKKLYEKVAGTDKPVPAASEPCLVVSEPTIPPVKSSEWEETNFILAGRNVCAPRQGVYVTFQRGHAHGPRVRATRADKEGCDRGEPLTKVDCWRQKIPLEKGPWEIKVPLPPLERLNNPPAREVVEFVIEVRDLANPNKLPEWSSVASVEQVRDL
jgi:hypothetical protein